MPFRKIVNPEGSTFPEMRPRSELSNSNTCAMMDNADEGRWKMQTNKDGDGEPKEEKFTVAGDVCAESERATRE